MVTRLDLYVGRIIEKLESEDLLENTIIFFTSDNGAVKVAGRDVEFFNSTANLRGMKRDLFEGGIRAPLIVHWPGRIAPGSQADHISAFEDVLPTLADISGSRIPEGTDGISFLPVLQGNSGQKKREYLYWEYPERGGKQAIRKDQWKAVRVNVSENPESPLMLFDLEKDPYETTDISAENPGVVKELRSLMEKSRIPDPRYPLYPGE
jgi:arylsulfatase A-like enzyme